MDLEQICHSQSALWLSTGHCHQKAQAPASVAAAAEGGAAEPHAQAEEERRVREMLALDAQVLREEVYKGKQRAGVSLRAPPVPVGAPRPSRKLAQHTAITPAPSKHAVAARKHVAAAAVRKPAEHKAAASVAQTRESGKREHKNKATPDKQVRRGTILGWAQPQQELPVHRKRSHDALSTPDPPVPSAATAIATATATTSSSASPLFPRGSFVTLLPSTPQPGPWDMDCDEEEEVVVQPPAPRVTQSVKRKKSAGTGAVTRLRKQLIKDPPLFRLPTETLAAKPKLHASSSAEASPRTPLQQAVPPPPAVTPPPRVATPQHEQQQEQEKEEQQSVCVICLTKRPQMVCLPCVHMCFCVECGDAFTGAKCPLCNRTLDRIALTHWA
eukprot:TRINITY_DN1741_c0_g1_i2.p1 TRINITY_DN1741_c0_g1~~TRINITY_DN1741_c0_g1_i2.p1  ORF type:complete len:396 (+),score=80.49 TRINITY_DN1741_c0_g1_i2:32-1189(+)